MRIYVFTDDELFNDSYPMKVVDDLYYEVEGKEDFGEIKNYFMNNSLEYHRKQQY